MKIKIGPVEIEQDSIKDEVLFAYYKESPKEVEKFLVEKSKFYDLTLKNIVAGKTMKMIRNFAFSIAGIVFFVGWSLYVFYASKDYFVWDKLSLDTAISVFLQAMLILGICLLPVGLIAIYMKLVSRRNSKNTEKQN